MNILFVDDDDSTREVMDQLIAAHGIANPMVCCASGEEALKLVEESEPRRFGIALIDLLLGVKMSGIDLVRMLRRNDELVTLIAVTGRDDPETIEAARLAGADAYIVKPFDVGAFLLTLAKLGRFDILITDRRYSGSERRMEERRSTRDKTH